MRKSGFTIPELLIVMVIMGLLLGIGIPNFKAQRDQLDFNQSVSRILEIIKAGRNYALTSRATTLTDGITKEIPKAGYGVYIDFSGPSKTMTLFANTGTDEKTYDPGDITEETYTLPALASIKSITDNHFLILFKPPLGEATMSNNLANSPTAYNDFKLELTSPAGNNVTLEMNAISGFPEVKFKERP
jgi:prepilin-type N-terminal cleavage/methylation domain-containing protein